MSTVADTLETVLSRMNTYLQQHPNMPEIRNPVLPAENFNRHWDQRQYANFRNRIQAYAHTGRQAKEQLAAEKAIERWQELFGEHLGSGDGSESTGGMGTTTPPLEPSRR